MNEKKALVEISKMKTGVGIINAARGGVVDEIALIKAIEEKKVKFAGLDVFEKEPLPQDHKLRFLPNALILWRSSLLYGSNSRHSLLGLTSHLT